MSGSITKSVAIPAIEPLIREFRGRKVIIDSDLAAIYAVQTKDLNRAVRRNAERFPDDFVFQLSTEEFSNLKRQFGTSSLTIHGGKRKRPLAFTEHGAIMAANVLNSGRAAEMSVFVVRAFVRLREEFTNHRELAAKLAELDRTVAGHDAQIRAIVEAIRQLVQPTSPTPKRAIGFRVDDVEQQKLKRRS